MTHSIKRVQLMGCETFGWFDSKSHAIRMDTDPSLALMASWRTNPQWEQDDYGVPAAGYYTAFGYWLPVEEGA